MEQFATLTELLVWPYIVIFVLLSYIIKKYFGDLLKKITRFEWKSAYTVLVIALIVGIPYGIWMKKNLVDPEGSVWVPMLLSYTVGTSFHELILKYLIEGVTKLFKKIFNIA